MWSHRRSFVPVGLSLGTPDLWQSSSCASTQPLWCAFLALERFTEITDDVHVLACQRLCTRYRPNHQVRLLTILIGHTPNRHPYIQRR